jgi:hypothetical protein
MHVVVCMRVTSGSVSRLMCVRAVCTCTMCTGDACLCTVPVMHDLPMRMPMCVAACMMTMSMAMTSVAPVYL